MRSGWHAGAGVLNEKTITSKTSVKGLLYHLTLQSNSCLATSVCFNDDAFLYYPLSSQVHPSY